MQSLNCIIAQSFANFEIILISNGNQHKDLQVAKAFVEQDNRVHLYHSKPFHLVDALNFGLSKASGKYIARTDADDQQSVDRLEKQLKYLKTNDLDAVACTVQNDAESESAAGLTTYIKWNNELLSEKEIFNARFIESPLVHPTILCKKSLFDNFGGYRNGAFPEDYELWLRWLELGIHIAKLPESLYIWNDHSARLTRTDKRYSDQAFLSIKGEYLSKFLSNLPDKDIYIWGNKYAKKLREELLARDITIKGLIDVRPRGDSKLFTEVDFEGTFILSAVRNWGAREKISTYLSQRGRIEGRDYLHAG